MRARYLFVCIILFTLPLSAAVTNIALYHLGESDPGAVAGATANATTVDSIAAADLTRSGLPQYVTVANGNAPASSLAVLFASGPDDGYARGSVVSTLTDNFGIEAWVRCDVTSGKDSLIAYNGNTGSSGWGLYRFGSSWGFLFGGVLISGTVPLTTGVWTHLALVRDNGTATLYVNGVATGVTSGSAPATPSGAMMVGMDPGNEAFGGVIDEVRVFSFAQGAFTPADLGFVTAAPVTPAVPALSSSALAMLAGLLLVAALLAISRAA